MEIQQDFKIKDSVAQLVGALCANENYVTRRDYPFLGGARYFPACVVILYLSHSMHMT